MIAFVSAYADGEEKTKNRSKKHAENIIFRHGFCFLFDF